VAVYIKNSSKLFLLITSRKLFSEFIPMRPIYLQPEAPKLIYNSIFPIKENLGINSSFV